MSGHYDEGYDHQGHGGDAYYQDDQHGYYDQNEYSNYGEGYYDQRYVDSTESAAIRRPV
jgi:1,3-beta-glucan synthase